MDIKIEFCLRSMLFKLFCSTAPFTKISTVGLVAQYFFSKVGLRGTFKPFYSVTCSRLETKAPSAGHVEEER